MPSTTEQYHKFCAANKISPRSLEVPLPDSDEVVAAHWIGDPDADIVVLYFHGGGYTQAGTEGYLRYWTRIVDELNSDVKSIAVLQLAYSLAPEARYPRQLQEAAAVLAHLITSGRGSSDIILAGDSAGGNLVLGLLSYVLHPHPGLNVLKIEGRLRGALLISPWVTFGQDHESFKRNYQTDIMAPRMLRRYAGMYLSRSADPEADPGRVQGGTYTEPLINEASWWNGLDGVVSCVLVWYGENEVFADAIAEFEAIFREGWRKGAAEVDHIVFVRSPGRAHIEPIMGYMLEPGTKGEHQIVIEEWFRAILSG
ncbi:hypothetical protein SLS60_000488 [Paraconiothyrium brasiliense]|uniref:Alpha/beta-hydrolase n=1 Tax=Paraconiothyrium brasiliense TaxID=300254 RepID=A0ABR3S6D3_9PLEO